MILKLVDIYKNRKVLEDLIGCREELFNYEQHRECALVNARQICDSDNPDDRENVFGIYHNEKCLGITGLWYEDHVVLKDLALLRWTSLRLPYRGMRLSPYIVNLITKKALAKKRSMLVEIAHTEGARDTFTHLGFKLTENNDRYADALICVLGESNGSYVLTRPIVDGFTYDWELVYNLAETIRK